MLAVSQSPKLKPMSGRERGYLRYLRDLAYVAQHGLCYWCEEPMHEGDKVAGRSHRMCTGEHLIPREHGGKTTPGNIVAACAKCNHSKVNYSTPLAQR